MKLLLAVDGSIFDEAIRAWKYFARRILICACLESRDRLTRDDAGGRGPLYNTLVRSMREDGERCSIVSIALSLHPALDERLEMARRLMSS